MSFSRPPGCRFYPSDEQLLCFYLTNKNNTNRDADDVNSNTNGYDLIKELDLYDYEPFDLPDNSCYAYGCGGRKRHWYCYAKLRVLNESRGGRSRRAKGGYWRKSGRVRDVAGPGGKAVIGRRTRFVFYLGNSVKSAIRTDWILYEYALIDRGKASYVLCRVFVKSRGGNSTSENMLSSCAEECVSAVRHVGIQHDGFLTPDIVEAKVLNHTIVDRNNMSRCSFRPNAEFDDEANAGRVSVASSQFPSGNNSNIESNKLVMTPRLPGGDMFLEAETADQLVSILKGDFIELDDLVD
ncbi:hypothetical protein JCGZ_16111 [Jatropha curcas]|uniref:NAC transcription factor 061 n=1 Tax=Jatropha curcas TaxID=180498 RepID=R4N5R6_JATCU|nr:NAC domain-containing protein 83 [Jatropha curcas]AGL39717.1 NAC transcription factor 061 [Jatropha curcas]KDP41704.1 hypothetical protein JCGZ_16111 [Jatropha curcas]